MEIGGQTLLPAGVYTERFSQGDYFANGKHFIIVVPDELAAACEPSHKVYAAAIHGDVNIEGFNTFMETLNMNRPDAAEPDLPAVVYSRTEQKEFNAVFNALFIFPLFYLALISTMTAATILTIQLLSDVGRYKKQYDLLSNLGMDKREMVSSLRRQFVLFYAMPALPPVAICVIFMQWFADLFDPGIITGGAHAWTLTGMALIAFIVIYVIYAAASYSSFKRNVLSV
jgi:hypothetical protein